MSFDQNPTELDDRAHTLARFLVDIDAGHDGKAIRVGGIARRPQCPVERNRCETDESYAQRISRVLKRAERMGLVVAERNAAGRGPTTGPWYYRATPKAAT